MAPSLARATTPPHTPRLSDAVILYRTVPGLRLHPTEGIYFQLFREHTAGELSGFFDDVFWTRMVLQECHTEDSIRHAVIALGALYKTLERSSDSPPNSPSGRSDSSITAPGVLEHWNAAIKQYSEALKCLMALSGQARSPPHRTLLMATVLLACFDSFVGDHKAAITQIQSGLKLLDQMREEQRLQFRSSPPDQEPVEEELVQMFNRLAIQAKSYDMAFHFAEPYVIRLTPDRSKDGFRRNPYSPPAETGSSSTPSPPPPPPPTSLPPPTHIPAQFTRLREARLVWDKLCERMLRFTEILMDNNTPSNRPRGILPQNIRHVGMGFKCQLEAWSTAFDPLVAMRTAPSISWQEKAGIAVLKSHQIMGTILFLMTFSDSELSFDGYQAQFRSIIDLASEVVGDEERRAAAKRCPELSVSPSRPCRHQVMTAEHMHPFLAHHYAASHIKPSFSADLGIVPPLYVVATKCRDRVIRRQAIQLLKSSARREGMWDSELTARIGSWVAEIEEEGEFPFIPEPVSEDPMTAAAMAPPATPALTPAAGPDPYSAYPSPGSPACAHSGAIAPAGYYGYDGSVPLGPGGNAASVMVRRNTGGGPLPPLSRSGSSAPAYRMRQRDPVPEEKRVMVKSVNFDLQRRWAVLQVGTRAKTASVMDMRRRETHITW